MRNPLNTESKVLDAITAHGTQAFTGAEIAEEVGVCRQTVYKIIGRLVAQGHRIQGEPRFGFMARLKDDPKPSRYDEPGSRVELFRQAA